MAVKALVIFFLIQIFQTNLAFSSNVKCIHNGKVHHPGEEISRSCNKCYCLQNGDWLCTQRICRLADLKGMTLIPSNDVILRKGSKLYVVCRSEGKFSRFLWFMNGQRVTSPRKLAQSKYGESILRLDAHDLQRKKTHVTCFVPPFKPKRITISVDDDSGPADGAPNIISKPEVLETSPNYAVSLKCKAEGRQPMEVIWFKFRVPLHDEIAGKFIIAPDGTLIIPDPGKSDSGLYECMVSNDIGVALSSGATELVVNKGLPINGGWCGWNRNGQKCTGKCDKRFIRMTRDCSCPAPAYGGADCVGTKEKLFDCIPGGCQYEIFGNVNVANMANDDVTEGSCLHIGFIPWNDCNSKNDCKSASVVTLRDFKIQNKSYENYVTYNMKVSPLMHKKYRMEALIQMGHCQEKLTAYEILKKDCVAFGIEPSIINSDKFANFSRVRLNLDAKFEEKPFTIRGFINLRPRILNLPSRSCILMILKDVSCHGSHGCRPMMTITMKNLTMHNFSIPYSLTLLKSLEAGSYLLKAFLNVGWCAEHPQNRDIKFGDFVNLKMKRIFVNESNKDLRVDLTLDQKVSMPETSLRDDGQDAVDLVQLETQGKWRFIETPFKRAELNPGSSSELKIVVGLPSDYDQKVSSSSCLIVTVRSEKICKNKTLCVGKEITKKVFRDIVKDGEDSIQVTMSIEPILKNGKKYLVDFVLNQGWCSEGATNASWIKDGDFFNSVEFQSKTKMPEINVVLKLFKENNEIAEKCNLKCPRILKPVCGSNNRTYNNLCILRRESCLFDSNVTLLHQGECERCKRGCSTKISPICARSGKTFDNFCIMQREACFDDTTYTFRHFGKCASVTMRGDVQFSTDQPLSNISADSCLIIKTRKAVYCKFPERCPDFELAEVVLKDVVVPPNGKIPYEVVMNPRPMSSVYLVEAVLNRGWCSVDSTSKEWIRNEDYFNVKEQPFAVEGSEEIYKDIPIGKLVNLKEVKKGIIPSSIRDPCSIIECPFHGNCHVVKGKGVCRCNLFCSLEVKPVCGNDGKTYGNECVLKSQSCILNKMIAVEHQGPCAKALKISGDILLAKVIPRIPAESCLTVTVQQKCNKTEEKCQLKPVGKITQEPVFIPPSNRIYYETDIKPRPVPGIYVISAVLNRGWCAGKRGGTEWIRIGDYYNDASAEFEITENGNIEKDVVIRIFDPKDGDKNSLIIKGEISLDETESSIPVGSCLVISLHHNDNNNDGNSCSGKCDPVTRVYVKDVVSSPNNKIPYQAVVKPRPKSGAYSLSVIFNRGWCSEGSNKTIREGDLFINGGRELEIGSIGTVYKDVNVTKYYPPGMPCMLRDDREIPNGADINNYGKGCHGCKCRNGSIICKPVACQSLQCSDGFLTIADGDCCPTCIKYPKCKDSKSGKMYKVNEGFYDRQKDYCKTCKCNMTGEFSCNNEICPKLECEKPVYIGSSCCPVCTSDIRCKDHKTGMLYKAGETWLNGEMNGCSKCKCVAKSGSKTIGFIECIKPSCPRLNCVQQVYPKGYCCPVCLKKTSNGPFKESDVSYLQALIFNEVVSSEVSCSDTVGGKIYGEGDTWNRDCLDYECKRYGIKSTEVKCPYLTCPEKYHVKKPGDCCPTCNEKCLPKLLCASDAVILVVPKIFLPYTRPTELVFNNCTSSANATHFILKTSFNQCGTKRSTEGENMKYSNMAYTREDENAVVSRVRLVKIPISCLYPLKTTSILSQEFIKRDRGISLINPSPKDTEPVQAFDIFMKVTDEKGVEHEIGKPIKFDPAERVFVEIGGTGLVENKVKVKADYCYLTPTPGPKSLVNYTLIENGCAVDSTVEIQEPRNNGQRFSFRAVVFTKTKVPGFYLHCDTLTCDEDDPACNTGCRERRALHRNEAGLITREKAAGHKRKMKLTLHVVVG